MIAVILLTWVNLYFDIAVSGSRKMVFIQPPEGQTWTVTNASVAFDTSDLSALATAGLMVWIEEPPYAPFRDPLTGRMLGCQSCVTLISAVVHEDLFFPVVGGYAVRRDGSVISGQTRPIVLQNSERIGVALNGIDPSSSVRMFVRVRINTGTD